MMKLPEPIQNVADELSNLPSIGPRQAIRLAFYLVGQKTDDVHKLAVNINNLRKLKSVNISFLINTRRPLRYLRNPNRNQNIIMIVEKETHLISLENTRKFHWPLFHYRPFQKPDSLRSVKMTP